MECGNVFLNDFVMMSLDTPQGSHGHGKPWKMKKIKYRPEKVMENENLAKSHGTF